MIKNSSGRDTMSVKELIKKLQKFDPNLPVMTEGCDCYGTAVRVIIETGEVVIKRERY